MTAACLAFAAVVYAPLAALTWTSALPSAKVLAAVAGLAVICTAVAFLLFFRLIAEVRPARASVITYIDPAVAVAIGVSVLGERLTPAMLGAFVLILGGSVLATRPGQHSRPSPGTEPACACWPGTADGLIWAPPPGRGPGSRWYWRRMRVVGRAAGPAADARAAAHWCPLSPQPMGALWAPGVMPCEPVHSWAESGMVILLIK